MKSRKPIVMACLLMALGLLALATACAPVLNNVMSYQGRLTDAGGNPINGTRNLTFRLFTFETGGAAIWDETHNGVQLTNGLFNVVLGANNALDEADFHQPLYLEIEVAGQTMSPRQPLTGAPYAFSLVPGAAVRGAIAKTDVLSSTLSVLNLSDGQALSAVSSGGTAIAAQASAETGWGVHGWASATSGTNIGVYGRSDSSGGYGVWGYGTEGGIGVYGLTTSGKGLWGFAQSTSRGHGVYAQSRAPGQDGSALKAVNSHSNGIALWGTADGSDSTMVLEHRAGSGDFIRAFQTYPSNLRFRVDVNGNVRADGSFTPGGADLAELLPATAGLEPGDVLVIAADGRLECSSQPYATNVAGVYSTKPGFLGGAADGADSTDKVPLAIVGVVPAKVCTENGAIQPGDLLVTSSTPGHGMKANDVMPGSILGKALGELKSGRGVIAVLVTLQ
jgi:hypothetical protein